jgi:predicted DsbA family dithiol-disulfide isomerase
MNPIDIRVISDFVCPWCPIGEKQLEAAVQAEGYDIPVRVTYEPLELNLDMPKEGLNRREYRSRKFLLLRERSGHGQRVRADGYCWIDRLEPCRG